MVADRSQEQDDGTAIGTLNPVENLSRREGFVGEA
jgi:hypothetical protein